MEENLILISYKKVSKIRLQRNNLVIQIKYQHSQRNHELKFYFCTHIIDYAFLSQCNQPITLKKRSDDFNIYCRNIPPISVKISPDPVVPGNYVTFTISGTLNKEINEDCQTRIYFADLAGSIIQEYRVDPPPMNLPNTPFQEIERTVNVPSNLGTNYQIEVDLIKNICNDDPDVRGCAYVRVPG